MCHFAPPFDNSPSRRAAARPSGLRLLQSTFPLFFGFASTLSDRQTTSRTTAPSLVSPVFRVCVFPLCLSLLPLQVDIVSLPRESRLLPPRNSPTLSRLKSVFEFAQVLITRSRSSGTASPFLTFYLSNSQMGCSGLVLYNRIECNPGATLAIIARF